MSKIIGSHIPGTLRNLAINGAMDFFQEREGNALALSTATAKSYAADMFSASTAGPTAKSLSVTRSTNVPSQSQSGYQSTYSLQIANTTPLASLAAADIINPITYIMEGNDYSKIHSKKATYGFWFSTTVAGVYPIAFRNSAADRSYVTTFSASIGYQFVTVTIQMDSTGTWLFDTSAGLQVTIGAAVGSTFQTSTLNQWQSGNFLSTSTAVNWTAIAGATINMTQFSIVEGPLGFGATGFQRAGDDFAAEFLLVQRYYEKTFDLGTPVTQNAGLNLGGLGDFPYVSNGRVISTWTYKVQKRVKAIVITYSPNAASSDWSANPAAPSVAAIDIQSLHRAVIYSNPANTAAGNLYYIQASADARL